jgi:hypothetical protein
MCALQPATRAHVNIAVKRSAGTAAVSSTTADQNSTFVARTRSGLRARSSARAAARAPRPPRSARPDLLGGAPQDAGARILGAVDPVAEAHEPLAAVQQPLDVALGVALALDVVEHLQHARGRAAVQRPAQRADGARERRGAVAPVEATTRAVNVEAFMPCSAAEIQ